MNKFDSPVSVCLAYYEGSDFIHQQLNSLIADLRDCDEIVLVNDSPWQSLAGLSNQYPLIRYYENKVNIGYVASFSKAISLASHDIIFLCDQDDIWLEGKREKSVLALSRGCLVVSDYYIFDSSGNSEIVEQPDYSNRFLTLLRIILGRSYFLGCVMSFDRKSFSHFIKIPSFVQSHDIYLAIIACFIGNIVNVPEPLICHRLHFKNVTNPNRSLFLKIKSRLWILKSIFYVFFRHRIPH